jgi:hypothetical protein
MADGPRLALFCEDAGHEQFVVALVERLADEVEVIPVVQPVSARGGEGQALTEFKLWQRSFLSRSGTPDLLVLVIDANCAGWSQMRTDLDAAVNREIVPRHVVGCPDPHVERWYAADPVGFEQVVGSSPGKDPGKCDREVYKRQVIEAAIRGGTPIVTSPAELAPDLVGSMDLYRAGKNQPSLKHFVDELRDGLRQLANEFSND